MMPQPEVFADTSYWLARYFRRDQWHEAAVRAELRLGQPLYLLTTQEVLTEFLASVAGNGYMRGEGVRAVEEIQNDPLIMITPQNSDSFSKGFRLYRNRMDKGYSLVDCISMNTMDEYVITRILTNDRHFEQEGRYQALMRQ